MSQQVHAPSSVSTEPLPSVNTRFSQAAVHRQIGRRIHLKPATPVTDPLNEETEVALRSIYVQEGSEITMPAARQRLQASDLDLVVGSGSDPGIKRRNKPNEDSIFAIHGTYPDRGEPLPVGLFVVADGMGGHASGQEASRLAIQVLSDCVIPAVERYTGSKEVLEKLLVNGVCRANLAVHERNQQEHTFMGTTVTAALVVGMTAYIVNVGDSRTYVYRQGGKLSQVTRDHSVVARLVEEKVIQLDHIYTHPRRNEIYRCLGEGASVEVDAFTVPLQVDDNLLLCSDGLWEMVHDPDIQEILRSSSFYPSQASAQLIQAALNRGGEDNVSAIVVQITKPIGER